MIDTSTGLWVPVKVPTGKKSLEDFMHAWKEGAMQGAPFNGEIDSPMGAKPERRITIDEEKISHCITDVAIDSFDPDKNTVMAKVRFCGPFGGEAREKFIKKDLRFMTRSVGVKHKKTGERCDKIVTIDCVRRPIDDKLIDDSRAYLESQKNKGYTPLQRT